MKKVIFKIFTTVIFVIATVIAIAQDSTLVGRRNDIREQELLEFKYARIDSASDFQTFKKNAELNVTNNKVVIDRLKDLKTKGDNESKAKYRSQISVLEDKNEEMAIKIAIADSVTIGNWASFKRHYNKEMIELKASLKNMSDYYLIN